MKYGSEGDKGWDAADAPWSGSSAALRRASPQCSKPGALMADGFRIARSRRDLSLDGNSASRASKMRCRCDGKMRQTSSLLAHLLEISREELAWRAGILREPRCGAVIRGVDGAVLPVIAAGATNEGNLEEQRTLSAPIYDPEGKPLVFLDLIPRDIEHSSPGQKLLRAIVGSAARAPSEQRAMPLGATCNSSHIAFFTILFVRCCSSMRGRFRCLPQYTLRLRKSME
jgi:hypothetical protein